jgi:glucosamine--fructose-6-phosphate aminotransferase (isomerizing)
MEASLKLKELSYIHAEALAAGELKHGPIALIDANTYTIALCPKNNLIDKIIVNIEEIMARSGKMIIISDDMNIGESFKSDSCEIISLDMEYDIFASPVLYSIVCQLLAYYVALFRKNNIDKPRNLAKSVTVE